MAEYDVARLSATAHGLRSPGISSDKIDRHNARERNQKDPKTCINKFAPSSLRSVYRIESLLGPDWISTYSHHEPNSKESFG
jgi:hypothetical protein